MEAFLERLRTGLGTHAPVLNTYGLDSEADFAQLHDDDVAAEEVWALLEANGCKRLQARAILKGMGLDPDLLEAPGATSIGVVVGREPPSEPGLHFAGCARPSGGVGPMRGPSSHLRRDPRRQEAWR